MSNQQKQSLRTSEEVHGDQSQEPIGGQVNVMETASGTQNDNPTGVTLPSTGTSDFSSVFSQFTSLDAQVRQMIAEEDQANEKKKREEEKEKKKEQEKKKREEEKKKEKREEQEKKKKEQDKQERKKKDEEKQKKLAEDLAAKKEKNRRCKEHNMAFHTFLQEKSKKYKDNNAKSPLLSVAQKGEQPKRKRKEVEIICEYDYRL